MDLKTVSNATYFEWNLKFNSNFLQT